MELYVGMDVSLKETSVCVVDGDGEILCEGTVISEPGSMSTPDQNYISWPEQKCISDVISTAPIGAF